MLLPLALGLSASLCWGLADFVAGVETRRLPSVLVVCVSQAVGLVGVACLAAALTELAPTPQLLVAALVAGVTSAIGITALYRALSIGTMSIVAPITATGAAVPVILGLIEGEGPGEVQALGIGAAAIGVLLVTQDSGSVQASRIAHRKSVALALVAAVALGLTLAALDRAATSGALTAVLWARIVAVTLLGGAVVLLRPSVNGVSSQFASLALIGALDSAATALYTIATTEGLLALVAVLASLYPVTTVVLARVLLRERVRRIQGAGIVAAVVGVVLIVGG